MKSDHFGEDAELSDERSISLASGRFDRFPVHVGPFQDRFGEPGDLGVGLHLAVVR